MSQELICAWLGLSPDVWPPDHYRLLGLRPGETDSLLIEERVHQRLDTVRRYQMTHPEPATEAMNRIAQAFVCLSEVASKRVYDAALLGTAVDQPAAIIGTATAVEDRDPLVLVYDPAAAEAPPPVRVQYDAAGPAPAPPVRLQYDPTSVGTAPPVRRPPVTAPLPEAIPVATEVVELPAAIPVEAVVEAESVGIARRGAPASRHLYRRLVQTRRLMELWNEAGLILSAPKRSLTRSADFNDLLRILREIRERLRSFAPLLGEAGQPGSLVLSLTELPSAPVFLALPLTRREELNRDWQAGKQVLLGHRDVLRQEARRLHKRTLFQRLGRQVRSTVAEKPGRLLLVVAVLALNIAICRTYVIPWLEDLVRPAVEKLVPTGVLPTVSE